MLQARRASSCVVFVLPAEGAEMGGSQTLFTPDPYIYTPFDRAPGQIQ